MKAAKLNLSRNYGGEVILSLVLDRESIRAAENAFDSLKDKEVEVTIKKYSKRRSIDANRYFWALAGKLAVALGTTKEEIYRHYIPDIGDNYEVVPIKDAAVEKFRKAWEKNGEGWVTETRVSKLTGYTNVLAFYGSSTFSVEQMSRLINLLIDDCHTHGIETATPSELALLLEEWR